MTWETAIWIIALAPPGIVLLADTWAFHIRPRLIPARRIEAMVDLMLATYGEHVELEAFSRQENEWYRGDVVAQGTWMLVRRQLWRRWERGEADLLDLDSRRRALSGRQAAPQAGASVDRTE